MLSSSLLSTLIALSGVFLGLSLLVQVLQEVYKYLTSSKSRSYLKVLVDFLGPFAYQLIRPGTLPELQSRGPLQWLRRRPSGRLQPLDRNDLASALERAAAPWIRRGLEALRLEAEIQGGSRRPRSPAFQSFMLQLAGVERGSPGFATAVELSRFLSDWQVETSPVGRAEMDAKAMLADFRRRFLPAVIQAETHFSQLEKNVEYAYRRRNLRQTFLIGLLLAVLFRMPFDALYLEASAVSLRDAVAATETLRAIYAEEAKRDPAIQPSIEELEELRGSLVEGVTKVGAPLSSFSPLGFLEELKGWPNSLRYLLGCLITTLLISFGAPFWNDLAGALLRAKSGLRSPEERKPAQDSPS